MGWMCGCMQQRIRTVLAYVHVDYYVHAYYQERMSRRRRQRSVQLRKTCVVEFLSTKTIFERAARLTEATRVRRPGLRYQIRYSASVHVALGTSKYAYDHLLRIRQQMFHACNGSWTLLRRLRRLMRSCYYMYITCTLYYYATNDQYCKLHVLLPSPAHLCVTLSLSTFLLCTWICPTCFPPFKPPLSFHPTRPNFL